MGGSNTEVIGDNAITPRSTAVRGWVRTLFSYALGVGCLVWVFHNYDFSDLLRRVAAMKPYWLLAAVLCDVLSYVCQGLRWRFLLRPFASISVMRSTQAIYAGLFVNEMLPMKLGELVRAFLVSRWTSIKLSSIGASILVERLCDGVWLATGIALTILLVPLPRHMVEAGDVFWVGVLVVLSLVALLAFKGRGDLPNDDAPIESGVYAGPGVQTADASAGFRSFNSWRRLSHTLVTFVHRLSLELHVIGWSRGMLLAFALSLAMLLLQGASLWLVMLAYGLREPFAVGIAVFLIVHLGTALPSAPANIGTYQFFTVLGLTLLGVDKTSAAGFSLVVFAVLSAPLWALGFWAFAHSGLTLVGMRTELNKPLPALKTNV
ncbi:MAG TPA: lysylphosphatidylglycerol synthase transmembrane domain-containing protein [Pyrinomonadaceae bacterium]|nr:lysylphosphatidylglycerol synthase transmembrane domain-containing protein [Pyrinomonadaceae bacterium]